jgi:outer membrane murein-binding lipoprotein Lpp
MKTIFTLALGLGLALVSQAAPSTDSTQLQLKVQQLEKQVQELKTEVKSLRSDVQTAGVKTSTPKKLVIERRGSKQAILQ